jgi:hypothetical protein
VWSPDGTRILAIEGDSNTAPIFTPDPGLIRRAFWLATPECLDPATRTRLLGLSSEDATRATKDCESVIHCLADGHGAASPDRYDACLEQFRKNQAALYEPIGR